MSDPIRTIVLRVISGSLCLRFWITVGFWLVTLWVDGVSDDKVVFNLRPSNFSVGGVLFLSGCEFKDNMARK